MHIMLTVMSLDLLYFLLTVVKLVYVWMDVSRVDRNAVENANGKGKKESGLSGN